MPNYSMHGLVMRVEDPFPGLIELPSSTDPEITVEWTNECQPADLPTEGPDAWSEIPLNHSNDSARFLHLWRKSDAAGIWHLLRFHGRTISEYLIPPSLTHIRIWRNPAVDASNLMKLGMGPVLGLILRLRGHLALHAGSFSIDGRAGLIVGPSGSGKSTLVMALRQAGCTSLADDMTVACMEGRAPTLASGRKSVRLCPDSLSWTGRNPADWPPSLYSEKREVILDGPGIGGTVPLAAIFLLGERRADLTQAFFTPLKTSDALITLSRELYPPFLPFGGGETKNVFGQLSCLVGQIPTFRISRPDTFDALPDLCREMIEIISLTEP